jgi:hypothetical protein
MIHQRSVAATMEREGRCRSMWMCAAQGKSSAGVAGQAKLKSGQDSAVRADYRTPWYLGGEACDHVPVEFHRSSRVNRAE